MRISSSRSERSALKPKTLPMIEAVRLAIEPSSNKVQVIGDVGDVLVGARHRVDPVALGLVVLVGREAVGPHHRPGRGGRFARHRGRGLDRFDALLRHEPKGAKNVGCLGFIVGLIVAHLGVGRDAGGPAALVAIGGRLPCSYLLDTTIRVADTTGQDEIRLPFDGGAPASRAWGERRHPLPLRQRTCGLVSGTMGAARPQYAQAMCLWSSDPVVWGKITCIMS
jgi:hypothetical protein